MTMTKQDPRDFAVKASPFHWMLVADNFHTHAFDLRLGPRHSVLKESTTRTAILTSIDSDDNDRAVFAPAAIAMGNALMAFLVYEKPDWTKRPSNVVGTFPNNSAVEWLIGAVLLEQNDEWAISRGCMSLESLAPVLVDRRESDKLIHDKVA